MFLRSLIAALALAASCATQAAPARLLADYTHTAWTRLQGAPSDVVKFAQTRDGWLWISSPGGLARFDGARFGWIETLGGHRLQSARTMGLLATGDGGLWIGPRLGGSTALVTGRARRDKRESEERRTRCGVRALSPEPGTRVFWLSPSSWFPLPYSTDFCQRWLLLLCCCDRVWALSWWCCASHAVTARTPIPGYLVSG